MVAETTQRTLLPIRHLERAPVPERTPLEVQREPRFRLGTVDTHEKVVASRSGRWDRLRRDGPCGASGTHSSGLGPRDVRVLCALAPALGPQEEDLCPSEMERAHLQNERSRQVTAQILVPTLKSPDLGSTCPHGGPTTNFRRPCVFSFNCSDSAPPEQRSEATRSSWRPGTGVHCRPQCRH